MELIEEEIGDLDAILKDYAEYDERVMQLKVDDIKLKYRNMLSWKEKTLHGRRNDPQKQH